MNFSDSERMTSFFQENNLQETNMPTQADLIVFNTCGVRQMAEDRVYGQVHNIYKKNPEKVIIITGCLAHRKDFQKRLEKKVDFFIPIKDFPNILKLIKADKNTKHYHTKLCDNENNNGYLKLKPRYERKNSALIPIMTGCNNFCSYCIVPYARGPEWSRSFEDILNEIQELANKNYREIILLGQNVNSFKNKKITFPSLLETLAKKFPQIKFNFLTSHPKDYSNELIKIIAENKNISREIHLPIQSGSDKILKAMNRPYTCKHYLSLIKETKKQIQEVKFSTDVIVGFPGESKKDFQETVKVFKKVKFSIAFVNKYSPRPGTASFKLEDNVSLEEKKRREKELRKYF